MSNEKSLFNKRNIHFLIIGIFFVVSIMLCFYPYLKPGVFGDLDSDAAYHLSRIESLAETLRNHVFPVKVHSSLCYGYGYGTGFFYSNCFLYLPAILIILGFDLGTAYKIFLLLIMIITYITGFYSTWKLTRHLYASAAVGGLILLSPSMISTTYYISSLGHTMAMPFIILCVTGLYIILERNEKPWIFIAGFWGLIMAHTITLVLTFGICFIMVLCYSSKLIKNPVILKRLIFSVVMVAGMSASYWAPMLEQYNVQQYKVSQPWTNVTDNVLGIGIFFESGYGPGIFVSACLLFIIFYLIWGVIRKRNIEKIDFILTGLAVLLSCLVMCDWFWNVFKNILNFIQFPFRLFYLITVLVILELGIIISRIKIKECLMILLIAFIIFINTGIVYYDFSDVFKGERAFFVDRKITDEVRGVGAGEEWLPIDCSGTNFENGEKAIADDGSGADGSKEAGDTVFNVYVDLNKQYYDIPYVYYYGYRAYLTEENGTVTELEVRKSENQDGKVRVLMPEDKIGVGKITIAYRKTFVQKISYLISILFYLIVISFLVHKICPKLLKNNKN